MAGAAGILHDKRYVSPCLPKSIFKASFKDRKRCDFHCGYLPKPKCCIQAPQVSALTPRIAKTQTFLVLRDAFTVPHLKNTQGGAVISQISFVSEFRRR